MDAVLCRAPPVSGASGRGAGPRSVMTSAVSRSSNGASSKYFIAFPSSDSSRWPVTMPAFSSRSRCMYSSGREIPSLRASSLTCTRPSASSAMTRSRSGLATAVSMVSSSSSPLSGSVSWVSVGSLVAILQALPYMSARTYI